MAILPNRPPLAHDGTKQRLANVLLNAERPFVLDIFEAIVDATALFFESVGHPSCFRSNATKGQPLPSKKHVT
jgi:hypothetical protein